MAGKSGKQMLSAGARAPEIRLRDTSGNEKTLSDIVAGRPTVLAFFKSSCPVCQYTLPYLERLKENGHLQIIAVSQDDVRTTEEFRGEFGLSMPVLMDEAKSGYPTSNGFGITHVPTMFQVEPDGTISHAWTGWSKEDMVALGARAGKPVLKSGEQVPAFRPG